MCELMLSELTDNERAEVAKAMAMINPYLQLAAVDWMAVVEETK